MTSVAVVGTGAVGSMALWRLAERGIPAVGFDAYAPGHDRGAAGGESRIFRTAYKEGPEYVPLLREARTLWEELERVSGRRLLTPVGGVTAGPRDHPKIRAVLAAARAHDLPVEVLTGRDARERVPEHPLREGEVLVADPDAGHLRPEPAVVAAANAAEQAGARIARYTPVHEVRADATGVTVVTGDGRHRFTHAVLAPGPWAATPGVLLPQPLARHVSAMAITSTWFPRRDETLFGPQRCPIAIRVGEPAYSCFPSVDGAGVKVNLHVPWRPIGSPESLPRSVPVAYVRQVAEAVAATLPGLRPDPIRVATYADAFSPDGHGLLGRMGRTVVAAAFSGHGFKLAPVFGDIVADLVETGATARGIGHLAPNRPLRRSP
ncbi:N-methyl-L-tryptophan oxidase [Nonomuraea terrae]|uniref:N-methyl-L-tryptophan oxidase n=1 Tax=Nonomuraea terrae TaxID=2530383 RepID=A0A4R4YQP4_9ACTN|nr:N-methyl-L-tryptophan oxidase [Nonomuraea terrae]TDD47535.1 N-methyl-L-tryptophan oxidase [Nonomuraea terrae]